MTNEESMDILDLSETDGVPARWLAVSTYRSRHEAYPSPAILMTGARRYLMCWTDGQLSSAQRNQVVMAISMSGMLVGASLAPISADDVRKIRSTGVTVLLDVPPDRLSLALKR